mmetsp:Transcript_77779/g.161592  ORF Transcript_77779/g.161592 Transcript_77779/m.161592 type:complete len:128 (+) Transcript_77779:58-441(+)
MLSNKKGRNCPWLGCEKNDKEREREREPATTVWSLPETSSGAIADKQLACAVGSTSPSKAYVSKCSCKHRKGPASSSQESRTDNSPRVPREENRPCSRCCRRIHIEKTCWGSQLFVYQLQDMARKNT